MAEEKLTLADRIYEVLKEAGEPLSSGEITIGIGKSDPTFYEKKGYSQIISEFSRTIPNGGHSKLGIYKTGNRKFTLQEWDNENEEKITTTTIDEADKQAKLLESDLYDQITEYLIEYGIYSMRIDEKATSNRNGESGFNKWLHPDIVGIKDTLPTSNSEGFNKFTTKISIDRCMLYSFEVKLEINNNNVRENFFQTLANSSWANYAYVICTDIKTIQARNELTMLCKSFGIGLINISVNKESKSINYEESEEIIVPQKKELDPALTNRIAEVNKEFSNFLKKITPCYEHGIQEEVWIHKSNSR